MSDYSTVIIFDSSSTQWRVVNLINSVPTVNNLSSVTYGNGQFVAVGDNGTILTSPDGVTWTSRGSGTSSNLNSVTYGNRQYVAVGGNSVLGSTDGIIWNSYNDSINYIGLGGGSQVGHGSLSFISYGNGQYWAIFGLGSMGDYIVASSDGIGWQSMAEASFMGMYTFNTCSNGARIVLGWQSPGTHPFISTNNGTWNDYNPGISQFTCGTYGNGLYVVMGSLIFTSTDGSTWTTQGYTTPAAAYNFITYGDSQYVAVGSSGTIINSPDGNHWILDPSGTINGLHSVVCGNGAFVAVGDKGTILISSGIPTAIKSALKIQLLSSVLTVQSRNSLLTISLPSAMLGKAVDLAVYSISGREIMRKRVNSGVERFTVPVSFSYGSYILVANDGSRKASLRFVAVR
jgi:hypothetical protein